MTTTHADGWEGIDEPGGLPAWLTNMPWWFVSAAIHLMVLLIATLVYVERMMAIEGGPIDIGMTHRPASMSLEKLVPIPDVTNTQKVSPLDFSGDDPTARDPASFAPAFIIGDHDETKDEKDT